MTYRSLCGSLSPERFSAYSLDTDRDSVDAVARYMWNTALASAFLPVLHAAEVAFRNAIYRHGCVTTSGQISQYGQVANCWLTAAPSLLQAAEARAVTEALTRLGAGKRRAGYLIAQLSFGFWVRLCDRPYEQGRPGPQLWPSAAKARFGYAPKDKRNRTDIRNAFDDVRTYRNLAMHHHPLWDRNPLATHDKVIELIGWMNPSLAATVKATSLLPHVVARGYAGYRTEAEKLVGIC